MFDQLNGYHPLTWSDELSSAARLYLNEKGSCSQFQHDHSLEAFREILDGLFFDSYEKMDLELVTQVTPKAENFDLTILSLEDSHDYGLACACTGEDAEGNRLNTCLLVAVLNPIPKIFGGISPEP
ncbi:MAG: hypothetical protein JKY52_00030 [Flavobacteriales bacterium]|nr:hypothetical protein [Flavobacteriales bacterium]